MLISDPRFSLKERVLVGLYAWRDSKIPSQSAFGDGVYYSNRMAAFEHKATQAIHHHVAKCADDSRWHELGGLWAKYNNKLERLKAVVEQRDAALKAAEAIRLPGDEDLSEDALAERKASRQIKPRRKYEGIVNSIRAELDSLADDAVSRYRLAAYEDARVALEAQCSSCVEYWYYRVANAYCQALRRRLSVKEPLAIKPFDENVWKSVIDRAMPAYDFSAHNAIR